MTGFTDTKCVRALANYSTPGKATCLTWSAKDELSATIVPIGGELERCSMPDDTFTEGYIL